MASKRESNRLRQIEQARIIDEATRSRRLKKHLDSLEQDNYQDDPFANLQLHKKLPKFEDTTGPPAKKKRKSRDNAHKQRSKKTFAQLLEEEEYNRGDGPSYLSAQAPPSKLPPRHFCSVCGFRSNYTCIKCGARYCSLSCLGNHKDTRCLKYTA